MTSDVFEANFGVPWMDVYDSLDVVRQGDLNAAHKVEGQPLLEEKIAPTYGELAAFAHNEQAWHAMRSFPSNPHHPLVPPPTSGLPYPLPL